MRKSRFVMSVVAAGSAGALAVGIPALATSDGPSGATTTVAAASSGCTRADLRDALHQAAANDPDLTTELRTLRSAPRGDRAATLRDYVSSHASAQSELRGLAQQIRACRASA